MAMDAPVLIQFYPCFDVIAYCGLAGSPLAKLVVQNSAQPFHAASPDGRLPMLRHGGCLVPQHAIIDYLKKNFTDLDAGLSLDVLAQIKAFGALVDELDVALDVARFDEDEQWLKVTRRALLDVMPWPASYALAFELRRQARHRIATATQLTRASDRLAWARERVQASLTALSARMPTQSASTWLLGTVGPTSLDAAVWGFLAHARGEPRLVDVANDFPSLRAFYQRALERIAKSKFALRGGQNAFVLRNAGPFLSMREGAPLLPPSPLPPAPAPARKEREPIKPPTEEEKEVQGQASEALVFALVVSLLYWGAFVQ